MLILQTVQIYEKCIIVLKQIQSIIYRYIYGIDKLHNYRFKYRGWTYKYLESDFTRICQVYGYNWWSKRCRNACERRSVPTQIALNRIPAMPNAYWLNPVLRWLIDQAYDPYDNRI